MKAKLKRKQVRIYLNERMERQLSDVVSRSHTMSESALATEIFSKALEALELEGFSFGTNSQFKIVNTLQYKLKAEQIVESMHLPETNKSRMVENVRYLRSFGVPDPEIQCVLSDSAWDASKNHFTLNDK